jgi:uncharacterized membrane protein (DUF4010 family)
MAGYVRCWSPADIVAMQSSSRTSIHWAPRSTREQSHGLISRLNQQDVHAFARYAVIAGAAFPSCPIEAWGHSVLWLVVVLVMSFSFAGYTANRIVGARKGVLA